MTELRVLCRAITYDSSTKNILLVRNEGQNWWYAPGGGWDYKTENITECVEREVFEETGVSVKVVKFLYMQTLYIREKDCLWLEQFWLAHPSEIEESSIPIEHTDKYGQVAEARWFANEEMEEYVVYPEVLREDFWKMLESVAKGPDRYLGHSII